MAHESKETEGEGGGKVINSAELTALKVGDLVTLKSTKQESYLCAEGILLEDLIVDDNVSMFDDTLFCVHIQRQYSAAREFESYLSTFERSIGEPDDNNAAKFMQALEVPTLTLPHMHTQYIYNIYFLIFFIFKSLC